MLLFQKYNKMIRCFLLTVVFVFVVLFFETNVFAEQPTIVVRVGASAKNDYYTPVGINPGYGYEYLNEIEDYSNIEFEYIYRNSHQELLVLLEEGKIDIMDTVYKNEELIDNYIFSDISTGESFGMLIANFGNDNIMYSDFESFSNKNIGIVNGCMQIEGFEEYAKANNFSYNPIYFDDRQDMEQALLDGRIDLMLNSSLNKIDQAKKVVAVFSLRNFYLITTKQNTELMDQINNALTDIHLTKSDFNSILKQRYYPENLQNTPLFTKQELEYIESLDTLKIAYDINSHAISDTYSSSNINEIIPNALMLALDVLGVEYEFVPTYSQDEAIVFLNDGDLDIVLPNNISPNFFRKEVITTDVLLQVPYVIISPTQVVEAQAAIGVYKNSLIENQIEDSESIGKLVYFDSVGECYQAMIDGQIDAVLDTLHSATAYIQTEKFQHLYIVSFSPITYDIVVGVSTKAPQIFVDVLNKAISSISFDQKNLIFHDFLSINQDADVLRYIFIKYQNEIALTISIIAASIVVFLIFLLERQRATKDKLWKKAYIDRKTGLPNLSLFKIASKSIFENNQDKSYVAIQVDIRKLSLINDIYGYNEGDRVIFSLSDELKKFNSDEGDFLARINADVFVMLKSYDKETDIDLYTIFSGISRRLNEKTGHFLQFAIGVCFCEPNQNIPNMNKKLIYAHKESKKMSDDISIYEYDDDDLQTTHYNKMIEENMRDALKKHEFLTYLQPKYCAKTEKIVGAEALVRWKTAEGKFIYPSDFIPLFEQNRFIIKLDMYMLENVCKTLRNWLNNEITPPRISVNFSLLHFDDNMFSSKIESILKRYNIPPHLIEIEITETSFLDRGEKTHHIIRELHNIGVLVSIDDFGAGYSSLGLLKSIAVDCIKLDKSFFDNNEMVVQVKSDIILNSVVTMCKNLDYEVVAEGIETMEQVEFLRTINCDVIQGYIFEKPIPIEEFEKLL